MHQKKKAFSIIELLVVVSIVVLMTGLTIGHLRNRSEKELLRGEAQKMAEAIHFAKKSSLSGLNPGNCSDTYTGNFVFYWDNNGYEVGPENCNDLLTYEFENTGLLQIESSVDSPVIFKVFEGKPSSSATLTIRHQKSNECIKVLITTNGQAMVDQNCL